MSLSLRLSRSSRRSLIFRLGSLIAAALVVLAVPAAPASGRAQDPDPLVTVDLVAQPVSYDGEGKLNIKVRVTNNSLQELPGFTVIVERGGALTSRSALGNSFETNVVGLALAAREVPKPLGVQASRVVTIDPPVTELFASGDEVEGIYAATVSLLDAAGVVPLDSFTTALMYYPNEVESRLNFVPVVPLSDLPARAPDGSFAPEELEDGSLEEALSPSGWLSQTLEELTKRAGDLRMGIAPTPRLVEEIADLSDGYSRGEESVGEGAPEAEDAADFIRQLGELLDGEGVQPLLVPYAEPDLPSLAGSQVDAHVNEQVAHGETVLREVLEIEPGRSWIFAPGGRIDTSALEHLQTGGGLDGGTFFSDVSLEDPVDPLSAGCPIEALSLTCPVSVETPFGRVNGYASDSALQDHLTALVREDDDRLNLQRFFAEAAMIRQEQPAISDRVLQATVPPMWRPPLRLTRTLYRGLSRAPWLKSVTPAEGLDLGIDLVEREVSATVPGVSNQLDDLDYAQIATADQMVESFNSLEPPPELTQRLARNVLISESRTWWMTPELASRGRDYAALAFDEARSEMDKISIEVNDRITLTSRAEDIPLRVLNDTGYPVKVRLKLNSPKLTFNADEVQTFDTGRTSLTIPVRAASSGIFRLTLALVTPDGSETVAETTPSVRSTEFNNIALVITVGALAFLVAFYFWRWYRGKRGAGSAGPQGKRGAGSAGPQGRPADA